MSDISKIDSNFKVNATIEKDGLRFLDVMQSPFEIYGVFYEDGKFRRIPEAVAKTVSNGVNKLHARTAGGRVRFKTDSAQVAIMAKMPQISRLPHMTLTGSAGFDMYVRYDEERFVKTFVPPVDITDQYEGVMDFGSAEMREITIHFPLYSEVSELYVGVDDGAQLLAPQPYREGKIVYYGSSITQGGCASRPGNAYTNILSRKFNVDHVNLGFAGNAKGEPEIAQYIRGLDMSVFVCDYDYNAPSVEHLRSTHGNLYRAVRTAHPDIPIIFMSRPIYFLNEVGMRRLKVITATYENAKADGDNNVYFIDGKTLMRDAEGEGNVDGTHPNDLGFYSMANAVSEVLEKLL